MDSPRVPALLDMIVPFVQAEASVTLRNGEEFIVFRPCTAETPAAELLARGLERDVALPLLGARTREEFDERLVDCLGKFTEARAAYRVLQRQGVVRFVGIEDAVEWVRQRSATVGGAPAAEAFEFAASTVHRAVDLAKSIKRAGLARRHAQRDLQLIQAFGVYRDIFHCAQYVVYVASERDGVEGVPPAVPLALELLRSSALSAYAAARERIELRKQADVLLEPLASDGEDRWLAGLAS